MYTACFVLYDEVRTTNKADIPQPLKRQSRLQQTTFINIFLCFSEKIRLDVSSESSARQRIHMKNQALFSSKDKSKKLKCRLLQFFFAPQGLKHTTNHSRV